MDRGPLRPRDVLEQVTIEALASKTLPAEVTEKVAIEERLEPALSSHHQRITVVASVASPPLRGDGSHVSDHLGDGGMMGGDDRVMS